jgi:hypothetical protein
MADAGIAFDRSITEQRQLSPARPGGEGETQIVQAAFVNHSAVVENALDNLEPERPETYRLREAISPPRRTQIGQIAKVQPISQPKAQPSIPKQDDREWRRLQAIMRKHTEISTGENTAGDGSEVSTNPPGEQEKTHQSNVSTNPPAGNLRRETSKSEILQAKPDEVLKKPEPGTSISSRKSVTEPGLSGFNRLVETETPGLNIHKETGSRPQVFPHLTEEAAPHSIEKPQSTGSSDIPLQRTGADRILAGLDSDLTPNQTARETGDIEQLLHLDTDGTGEKSKSEKDSSRQPPLVSQMKKNLPAVQEEASDHIDAPPKKPASSGSEVAGNIVTNGLIQQEQDSIPSQDLTPSEEEKSGLPLEAVWPVSVQKNQPLRTEGPLNPSTQTPLAIRQPGEDAAIQQVLSGVEIGSPTDSQVELIVPRRPRPAARRPQPEGNKVQESPKKPEAEHNAPVIQESPQDEKTEADKKPPVQKSIYTEIGPLPSDLWQLIGQPAPIGQAEPSSIEGVATHKRTENYINYETIDTIPEVISRKQDHPFLQRQEEPPAAAPIAIPAASAANEPQNNSGNNPLSPQEKAELNQRVYFEIKRRLAVEWERLRHKR